MEATLIITEVLSINVKRIALFSLTSHYVSKYNTVFFIISIKQIKLDSVFIV